MESLDKIIEKQILQEEYEGIMEASMDDEFFDVLLATDAIVGDEDDSEEDFEDLEDDDLIDYVDGCE